MTGIKEMNPAGSAGKKDQVRLFSQFGKWLRSDLFKCILMDIAAYLIILVIFFFVCVPKKYDLSVDSIAPETIKATRDVIDEEETNKQKDEQAAKVPDCYVSITEALEIAFRELQAVHQYAQSLVEPVSADSFESGETLSDNEGSAVLDEETATDSEPVVFSDEEISQARQYLNYLTLTNEQIDFVMHMPQADFDSMVLSVRDAITGKMNSDNKIEGDIDESIAELMESSVLEPYKTILPELLNLGMRPNQIFDQETTDRLRQEKMDSVEPVIFVQGRTIIFEGQPVTEKALSLMSSLGLLNDQTVNYSVYVGSAITVLVAMICLLLSLKLLRAEVLTDIRKMAVVLIVLIISVISAALAHLLPNQYVIPLSLAAILGTVLIGYRTGICLTFANALIIGALTSGNASSTFFDVVLLMSMTVAESVVSVWFLKGKPQRVRLLVAGFLSAAVSIILIVGMKYLTSNNSLDILSFGAWAFAGGIISGVLAVAVQPALEQTFRLATPSRLLELTNPNQPLMKRLMIEAPGTYHHSIIVANLAEAAADKIQANPYLARAGAYYHDIGKLKRPGYFKENQNGDNPHERTDPYVSAAILISHTMDGVLLAQKEHLPREVQDIILQHHGVTPVMFFYHKALQMSDGSHVDIDEFRYSGPKPKTKEAAIVMLSDTIEAAVRSMKDPTPKGIDQFIERLVRGKLEDGQLSDSPLSLSDIDQICDAFSGILKGVYHERIEYPNVPHYAGKSVPVPQNTDTGTADRAADTAPAAPVSQETARSEENKTVSEQTTEKDNEESSGED